MDQPQATSAPGSQPQGQPQGNGLAVAGMVLGILGLVLCWASIIGWILSLLGIILGAVGWAKANRVGRGKGMAIAGVITGVLGLILGVVFVVVVASAFTDYMKISKKSEASLQLNKLGKHIKMYFIEKSDLPPSAGPLPGPDGGACGSPTHKLPVVGYDVWAADPGWAAMDFAISEPSMFTYHWTRTSETAGYATAVGDLDCDGEFSTTRLDVKVDHGNPSVTIGTASPD